jgi:zinc/manganese transport system substrate-binding protein
VGVLAVACGSDDTTSDATTAPTIAEVATADTSDTTADVSTTSPADTTTPADTSPDVELPTIVVTTNILGDIVTQTVGDLAEVEVIMPVGADPHDFAPSARQAESMENADLLVTNGAGFEEGMLVVIEQVESTGTPVFSFADNISLLQFAAKEEHSESDDDHDHDHDHGGEEEKPEGTDAEHSDEEHSDAEHSDDEHNHSGDDPHIWTDPSRMITAVEAFGAEFALLDGVDAAAVEAQVQSYIDELIALDAEMETTLSTIPAEQRVLVTNHEVFGYFADRFAFEVVGAVIPSSTTNAEPSTAEVEELVALIEQEQIPAIFADTSSPTRLAEAIASSAGGAVEVVLLYSESLGEPGSGADTYLTMMATNATLIADALTPA